MQIGPLSIAPNLVLAPMAAVTDLPFRTVCEEAGVGLTITEFLSARALSAGAKKIIDKLQPSLNGRPFGVQIFGREEDAMQRAAEMAVSVGASLVDINMGCPAKRVVAGECGSALMREPALAAALVRAVRRAVPPSIPVTVKHRAGWDDRNRNAPEFAQALVEAGAAMITVHGRTRSQGFSGRADLEIIRRVREALPPSIPVVGNGDVVDVAGYRKMVDETGCDAVMVGRGAMGNPWLFLRLREVAAGRPDPGPPTLKQRRMVARRHTALILEHTPPERYVTELRKSVAWYTRGLRGGSLLRQKAWALTDHEPLQRLLEDFFAMLACSPSALTFDDPPRFNAASSAA
jgi:nifR3 family TIM-barrel protein